MSIFSNSNPQGTGSGNPPEAHAETPGIRALKEAVRVLDTHRETMAKSAEEVRLDVREMRDRMARLETKVDNLPTKDWIGGAVNKAVGFAAALVTIAAAAGALILHLVGK